MIKRIFQRIGPARRNDPVYPVDFGEVEQIIHYKFKDRSLLQQAFKHRSYLTLSHESAEQSNERLEFLGDAVLDLLVTEHLFRHFPEENEGDLSAKKSVLVSRRVVGKLVEELDLGRYLLINRGEEKTGGRSRLSNLANLFESLLGAIYLDGGVEPAKKFVHDFLLHRMDEFLNMKTLYNYKSALLEFSQAQGWGAPQYRVIHESGPDHNKRFIVAVAVNDRVRAQGSGLSKKKAEQMAAQNALIQIKENQGQRDS